MRLALVALLVGGLVAPVGAQTRLAPDGAWVGGHPQLAPGWRVGRRWAAALAPDGSCVGGRPRLAPDGTWYGDAD
jgi:hypothetical protein